MGRVKGPNRKPNKTKSNARWCRGVFRNFPKRNSCRSRHFRRCRILFHQPEAKTASEAPSDYSFDYLVNYCNQRWSQWTSDTTDEFCRVIQQHSTDPTEANRMKLANIEHFSSQMYTVRIWDKCRA